MSTQSISLPVVGGGLGASTDVTAIQAKKTFVASGVTGNVIVEASADGTAFCQIGSFQQNKTDLITTVNAKFMRVNATGGAAAAVWVMAERGLAESAVIPSPPSNAAGAAVDVTDLGCNTTIYASGVTGPVGIEVSPDGTVWSPDFKTFTTNGCQTKDISAKFIRAVGKGGSATLFAVSEEPSGTATTSPLNSLVYRPNAPATGPDAPGGNVFTEWIPLQEALDSTYNQGWRSVMFDNRFATPNPDIPMRGGVGPCVIPAIGPGGPWNQTNVRWLTSGIDPFVGIEFADGCVIQRLKSVDMAECIIVFNGTVGPSPLPYGFGNNDLGPGLLFLGYRQRVGNTLAGVLPMLRADDSGGGLFVDTGPGRNGNLLRPDNVSVGGAGSTMPSPLLDVNGRVFLQLGQGCGVWDNTFTDNSALGGGLIIQRRQDDAADGQRGDDFSEQTWSHPSFSGNSGVVREVVQNVNQRFNLIDPFTADGDALHGDIVPVDTSGAGADVTITLQSANLAGAYTLGGLSSNAPRKGTVITIKDVGGAASTVNKNIIIAVQTGESLDGVVNGTKTINTDYGFARLYCDGIGGWWTIG